MARQSVPKNELVVIRNGKPFTNSLAISEEFKRPHFRVLKSIKRLVDKGKLTTGVVVSSWVDSTGRSNEMLILDERSALIAMPFIGGENAENGQIILVDSFLRARSELARIARQQADPEWRQIRDKTKVGYEWMSRTLQERREAAGKATKSHHYANEARLVNAVLSGRFEGVNRNTMTAGELDLMSDLQRLNAILIGQDLPYAKRKEILLDRSITKIPEIREPAGLYGAH